MPRVSRRRPSHERRAPPTKLPTQSRERATPNHRRQRDVPSSTRRRRAVCALVAAFISACAPSATDLGPDSATTDAASEPLPCNLDARLCDRRLVEICLAGAHNAMASTADGFAFPNQDLRFDALLELGVRALLLDVHVWQGPDGHGPAALYLCHGSCLLGATPLGEALLRLRGWLDAHPRDFVVVVLEVAAPTDAVVAAIDAAGLSDRALRWSHGATHALGALLDAGKQLLWTAESGGGAPDWYHDQWALVRETPYTFHSQAELRDEDGADDACRPDRGSADAPLLQVNHWVAKVLPTVAQSEAANALPVLLARAGHCATLRGGPVNLLVVDHASRGEVVRAARILNGLEAAP